MVNPGINELQCNRQKLLDGLAANKGFEDGLYESAKNQYAQQCHFIYELLQNAGDAQATKVEFILSRDSLEFRHNGERTFDLNDVDSITNYHQSTKKNSDAVGKFGMGFKSVFHYTTAPEIHSGDFHFRIERMFFPATEGVRTDEELGGWTKFIFPFNHPTRSSGEIFNEVMKGLKDIRSETLLFLKRITQIECLFNDGSYVKIVREEKDHIVCITRETGSGKKVNSYFLKFLRKLSKIAYGKQIEVALAYGLVLKEGYGNVKTIEDFSPSMFRITPINGRVFIYFPAERETSNLKFHIHASFATPISREALTDCKDNDELVGQIADLAAESMFVLKDEGFLDVETMAVLPNPKDPLSERYAVIRERLVKEFNTKNLTPTKSGGFKPANLLIRSENRMSDLFSDSDMAAMFWNYVSPVWVKAPSMLHSREDDFLSSLDLEIFGYSDLLDLAVGWDESSGAFVELAQKLSDKKLYELYRKLAEAVDHVEFEYFASFREIFRTTNNLHSKPSQLFFDAGLEESGAFQFLKKIYKDSDSKVLAFLREVGVKTYSIDNVIRDLMEKMPDSWPPSASDDNIKRHVQIVKLFIAGYKKDPSIVNRFKDFKWLCGNKEKGEGLGAADVLLIDNPYEDTKMSNIAHAFKDKRFLSRRYRHYLSENELETLKEIFGKLPFIREYKERYIEQSYYVSLWGHPCYFELKLPDGCRQRDPRYWDCDLDGVEGIEKRNDEDLSRMIWQLLPKLKSNSYIAKNPFKATCRHSASCTKSSDSLLICHLRSLRWLKNQKGKWVKPEDVSFSSLHEMYSHREMNDALRLIGFGKKASEHEKALDEKKKAQNELVKELGADSAEELKDALEWMRAAMKEGIDVKGMILKKRMAAEMPEGATSNLERRKDKTAEAYADSESQTREMRERSVKSSLSMAPEARKMLQGYYTDDRRKMRCQLCRDTMPFRKRDGEEYFECIQIFRDMKKESKDQYLALCPMCSAAYDEWIRKHEGNSMRLREAIIRSSISNGQGGVSILLPDYGTPSCGTPPTSGLALYFVAKHFVDVKTVLEQENMI